jgi:hypothetical protein
MTQPPRRAKSRPGGRLDAAGPGVKMRARTVTGLEPRRLLLTLTLPLINPYMTTAIVDRIHLAEGAAMALGGKLMDVTVDLSAAAPHDCPPVSHYRIVVRDKCWLRRLDVAPGDEPALGARLGLFSTEPDEPLDGAPAREVRVSIAGVLQPSAWGALR